MRFCQVGSWFQKLQLNGQLDFLDVPKVYFSASCPDPFHLVEVLTEPDAPGGSLDDQWFTSRRPRPIPTEHPYR